MAKPNKDVRGRPGQVFRRSVGQPLLVFVVQYVQFLIWTPFGSGGGPGNTPDFESQAATVAKSSYHTASIDRDITKVQQGDRCS